LIKPFVNVFVRIAKSTIKAHNLGKLEINLNMKLTAEQQKKALEKLQNFFSRSCHCSSHEWLLNDKILELREFSGGNLIIGGQTTIFPVIAVSCKQCGNTHFFNAVLLDLIDKKDESAK
jgi:predicted nucleic-acid-binding Zn-ribbon protein